MIPNFIFNNYFFTRTIRSILRKISSIKEKKRLKSHLYLFKNKIGLEIGGPSNIFSNNGEFPIYSSAKKIDGCNFSNKTIWEGNITNNLYLHNKIILGNQYICDVQNINSNINLKYDFIISSNCLEHIANPLKAIEKMLNVLNKEGLIVLIVPNKTINFDHYREYTPFNHLLDDFKNDVGNDDLTHYEEIIQLHDLRLDPLAGTFENFKKRSLNNHENRCLHHHVFSIDNINQIILFFNLKIIILRKNIENIILIAKKQ